jgi:hypothetical protein
MARSKWRRGRHARSIAYANLKIVGAKLLTLAISVLGAMLISYGVWQVYGPAGYVVGGVLLFALQWSHEKDKERR